jgi:cephalosporin hydroxylase
MHIETTARFSGNSLILNDENVLKLLSSGQEVKIIVEDIKIDPAVMEMEQKERLELLKILNSFSKDSCVITPDGLIKREDAYEVRE